MRVSPVLGLVAVLLATPCVGGNLLVNGSFDGGAAGWSGGSADGVLTFRCDVGSTLVGGSGPGALDVQLTGAGSTWACAFQDVPVSPLATIDAAVSVYVPGAANAADSVNLSVQWANRSFSYSGSPATAAWSAPTPGTWTRLAVSGTGPADAVIATISLCVSTTSAVRPASAIFDDASAELAAAGSGYAQELFLPVASSKAGRRGTFWRTDLWVENRSWSPVTVLGAVLLPGVDNAARVSAPVQLATVPSRGTVALSDVVGALGASVTGALYLRAEGASAAPLITAASRNYTPDPDSSGGYGQGLEAVDRGTATTAHVVGLFQGGAYRTNLGVLNTSGRPITVEVDVFDGDGGLAATRTWTLEPYQPLLESLADDFGLAELDGGSAVFRLNPAEGSFRAYASVADNGSGDSVFIPARP